MRDLPRGHAKARSRAVPRPCWIRPTLVSQGVLRGDGRPIVLPGGDLVIAAVDAGYLLSALEFADRAMRRDGIPMPVQLRRVREGLIESASHARRGHADVREGPDSSGSCTWMTTRQIADFSGYSARHCARLAKVGAFGQRRRRGKGYVVREDLVTAHFEAQAQRAEEPGDRAAV